MGTIKGYAIRDVDFAHWFCNLIVVNGQMNAWWGEKRYRMLFSDLGEARRVVKTLRAITDYAPEHVFRVVRVMRKS